MERGDDLWRSAHAHAHNCLRRYGDAWTRSHRDDLVQETTIAAWQWAHDLRDPRALWAAVRTIARRVRHRGLRSAFRDRVRSGFEERAQRSPDAKAPADRFFTIAGRRVPAHRVLQCVEAALEALPPHERQLLLEFHEGFCCAELSLRCNCSETAVKTRLHRARRRVQKNVEDCVRAANGLDPW